jgi:NAD(P)-dependent dehydrogenase (short-subunit alcohol dehydrogenase family)
MMRQGWGRIINVMTSLGTMLNAGSPTYGPSKVALEALSAIMAKDLDGTGVTVNVLVPGGVTNTPMISDEAGFLRDKLIQPEHNSNSGSEANRQAAPARNTLICVHPGDYLPRRAIRELNRRNPVVLALYSGTRTYESATRGRAAATSST